MKAVKRAGWSIPDTYDASKITAIGFLRRENALSEGSEFPKVLKKAVEFNFVCMTSGSLKGDNGCGGEAIFWIEPIKGISQDVDLLGKEVQVYSVSGEKVWSGLWNGNLDGFSKGLYFLKWQNQILKFNYD